MSSVFQSDSASQSCQPPSQFRCRHLHGNPTEERRTNDEIHSSITLDPVTCVLLDTPPMQRLRGLKQLGTAEYVYMNTNHNRFEHSLGVAHLAERLCRVIQHKQPQLGCTDKDVLCVKLAGLFHDVGHGPFSHMFEEFVNLHLPAYLEQHPNLRQCYEKDDSTNNISTKWKHESASLMMLDAALEHLGLQIDLTNLDKPLRQIGHGIDARSMRAFESKVCSCSRDTSSDDTILTSRDLVFIKEAIHGGPIPEICAAVEQEGFVGRPGSTRKEWLYDIVNNRHSGLDVDKIDYFARDQRRAFREAGEIDKVMIENAVVAWVDCPNPKTCQLGNTHLMICYPEKMVGAAMEFFRKRYDLHSRLYQHKTHGALSRMISDILCKADPYFRIAIPKDDGTILEKVPISRAMRNPRSYVLLQDSVIGQIANMTSPELAPARRLIARLSARDLYKCIGTKFINRTRASDAQFWSEYSEKDIVEQMLAIRGRSDGNQELVEDDLFVHKVSIHCGLQDKNPLSSMRFLEKRHMPNLKHPIDDLPTAVEVEEWTYEASIPRSFISKVIRVYCRDSNKVELAEHVFQQWLVEMKREIEYTLANNDDSHSRAESGTPRFLTQDSGEDSESDRDSIDEKGRHVPCSSTAATITPVKRKHRHSDSESE